MGLETGDFINDFNLANPAGGDLRLQGDDHLRLVKKCIKQSFPNIAFARYVEQARADVADASTPALWAATTDYANLLGTTAKTGFANGVEGQMKLVRLDAAMVLTHNAVTLDLPSGANITTVAGDHMLVRCRGMDSNVVLGYWRKSGQALISGLPSQTSNVGKVLGTNGTAISWVNAVPTGMILHWPTSSVPTDYLECNGAQISRSTYAALFAVLGTTYGVGDGSTTFNLPDLRGEFVRGWDHGRGLDPDKASRLNRGDGTTGDNVGTKQDDQLLSHNHTLSGLAAADGSSSGPRDFFIRDNGDPEAYSDSDDIQVTGGNETRPNNVYLMYVIRT